jgi:hypothetical protein
MQPLFLRFREGTDATKNALPFPDRAFRGSGCIRTPAGAVRAQRSFTAAPTVSEIEESS